jgi:hypothetical protein
MLQGLFLGPETGVEGLLDKLLVIPLKTSTVRVPDIPEKAVSLAHVLSEQRLLGQEFPGKIKESSSLTGHFPIIKGWRYGL